MPAAGAAGRLAVVRGLLLVYGVSTWLPQMMRAEGYGLSSSVGFLMVINAGGIVGLLIAGRTADRFGAVRVSAVWFVLTAARALLLRVHLPLGVTYAVVAVAGVWLFSAQVMVYAATHSVYRDSERATCLGWVTGIGRTGARPRRERQPALGLHDVRARRVGGCGDDRPRSPRRRTGRGAVPATAHGPAPEVRARLGSQGSRRPRRRVASTTEPARVRGALVL